MQWRRTTHELYASRTLFLHATPRSEFIAAYNKGTHDEAYDAWVLEMQAAYANQVELPPRAQGAMPAGPPKLAAEETCYEFVVGGLWWGHPYASGRPTQWLALRQ